MESEKDRGAVLERLPGMASCWSCYFEQIPK